jgi:hypothetical protein
MTVRAMRKVPLLFIVLLPFSTACDRRTVIIFEGGNPPVFVLSGSGELGDLRIYGPQQREVGSDLNFAIWEIQPIKGYLEGERLERLGRITYGVIPEGYKQIYPEHDAAVPPLVDGQKYEYWFQTINAPEARAYFEIRDGKAVEIPK